MVAFMSGVLVMALPMCKTVFPTMRLSALIRVLPSLPVMVVPMFFSLSVHFGFSLHYHSGFAQCVRQQL
jgi:hypothetical protein